MNNKVKYLGQLSLRSRLVLASLLWSLLMISIAGAGIPILISGYITDATTARLQITMEELLENVSLSSDNQLQLDSQPSDRRYDQPLSGFYWQVTTADQFLTSASLVGSKIDQKGPGLLEDYFGPLDDELIALQQVINIAGSNIELIVGTDKDPTESIIISMTGQVWIILALTILPALLTLHIAGALWHKLVRRDGVLESMTGRLPF